MRRRIAGDSVLDSRCDSGAEAECRGNIWYMNWSDDRQPYDNGENVIRNAENRYWKSVDALRIPTSTTIVGVKIILEFYEGQAPSCKRTGWVMHEYEVKHNDEANVPQDYKSLCTIFLQGDKKFNAEDPQISLNANAPNDRLESYLQYLAEIEEQNATMNSQFAFNVNVPPEHTGMMQLLDMHLEFKWSVKQDRIAND